MKIKVRLFASFKKHLPGLALGESAEIHLEPGTSIKTLWEYLGLPDDEVKINFVNGISREGDFILSENDDIGIFPLIGGG